MILQTLLDILDQKVMDYKEKCIDFLNSDYKSISNEDIHKTNAPNL